MVRYFLAAGAEFPVNKQINLQITGRLVRFSSNKGN